MTEHTPPPRRRRNNSRRTALLKGRVTPAAKSMVVAYAAAHSVSQAVALEDILSAGLLWLAADLDQPSEFQAALATYREYREATS